MMYARVHIEMDLTTGFLDEVFFTNEVDELVSKRLSYDRKPTTCTKCLQLVHSVEGCRDTVQQWRVP